MERELLLVILLLLGSNVFGQSPPKMPLSLYAQIVFLATDVTSVIAQDNGKNKALFNSSSLGSQIAWFQEHQAWTFDNSGDCSEYTPRGSWDKFGNIWFNLDIATFNGSCNVGSNTGNAWTTQRTFRDSITIWCITQDGQPIALGNSVFGSPQLLAMFVSFSSGPQQSSIFQPPSYCEIRKQPQEFSVGSLLSKVAKNTIVN